MRRARKYLMLLVPLLWAGCTPAEDDVDAVGTQPTTGAPGQAATDTATADAAAIEAEVDRIREAWSEAARAGDAARVAQLYTEDAVFVGVDGQAHQRRQAIQDALAPGFAELTNLEISSTDTEVSRDLVTDMGEFTQTFQSAQGQSQTVSGTYLVVLRRQADGMWRIVQHHAAVPSEEVPGAGADTAAQRRDTAAAAADTEE